jgi:hypothetical protein
VDVYRDIEPKLKKIPVGARILAHVQTSPGAHPASCTMGTGSFPGVKRLGRGADHPPLLAPRSKRVELYLYSPSRPSRPDVGRPLPFNLLSVVVPCSLLICCATRTYVVKVFTDNYNIHKCYTIFSLTQPNFFIVDIY